MSESMGLSGTGCGVKMNPQIKEVTESNPKVTCIFCHSHEINAVEWGPMYQLDNVTVHYFCLLFSAGLSQEGEDDEGIWGFLAPDILKEAKRGDKLRCKYCKRSRATVGCIVKTCKFSFHYTCGLSQGTLHQFHDQFSSYCPHHKPAQPIPDEAEWQCPICFTEVETANEAVWPPCCGKKLFHRSCLMHTAKEAGYFFKCPLCNNATDKFLIAMKSNGVFVPEQDAAWERVPNAFSELTEQYAQCDTQVCQCPGGRGVDSKDDMKWKIIRCNGCGSSATHTKCAGLQGILSWKCSTCSPVLLDNSAINTSSLVSAVRSRRTRVDERNLNYSDSEDETSEGNSNSSDSTSDEEEKILRSIPNATTLVRNISSGSSSEDDRLGLREPLPNSSNIPESDSGGGEDEVVYNPTFKKQYRVMRNVQSTRKRKQKIHKVRGHQNKRNKSDTNEVQKSNTIMVSQVSSSMSSTSIANNLSDSSVSSTNNREGKGRHGSRRKNPSTSLIFQKKIKQLRQSTLYDEEEDEKTSKKLDSIFNDTPSEGTLSRRIAEAKRQQETLQSVLNKRSEPAIDVSKLPKIPKLASGIPKSTDVLIEGRKSILDSKARNDERSRTPAYPECRYRIQPSEMESNYNITEPRIPPRNPYFNPPISTPSSTFYQNQHEYPRDQDVSSHAAPTSEISDGFENQRIPLPHSSTSQRSYDHQLNPPFPHPHHDRHDVHYQPPHEVYRNQPHRELYQDQQCNNFDYMPRNNYTNNVSDVDQLWYSCVGKSNSDRMSGPPDSDYMRSQYPRNYDPYSHSSRCPPVAFYDDTPTTYMRKTFNLDRHESESVRIKREQQRSDYNTLPVQTNYEGRRYYHYDDSVRVVKTERKSDDAKSRSESSRIEDKPGGTSSFTSTSKTPALSTEPDKTIDNDCQMMDPALSSKVTKTPIEVIDLDDSDDEIEIITAKVVTSVNTSTAKSAAFVSLLSSTRNERKAGASSAGQTVISLN